MQLSPEKMAEAFRSAHDQEPLFVALTQLLDEYGRDESAAAISPDLTPDQRSYNCGRASSVQDLREYVSRCRSPK